MVKTHCLKPAWQFLVAFHNQLHQVLAELKIATLFTGVGSINTLVRFLFLSLKKEVARPRLPILPVRPILKKYKFQELLII